MVTEAQLEIYRRHWGDEELLLREGRPAEIAVTGESWSRMEALIQDTRRLYSDPVSPETAAELRATIQRNTADEATRQLLRKLAHDWPRIRPRLPLFLFQRFLAVMLTPLVVVANSSSWLEGWGQNAAVRLALKGLVLLLFWLLYKAGTGYLLRLMEP